MNGSRQQGRVVSGCGDALCLTNSIPIIKIIQNRRSIVEARNKKKNSN